jgi:tetratricopeptide (TPR) repeat protein
MKSFLKIGLLMFAIPLAALAAGSGSGGSGSGGSELKQEAGDQAVKVYNQGVELMRAKKYAAAQAKFEQAVRANPKFAEAHNNLGYSLRKQGSQNYAKALDHYNQAIRLKPNLAEAYEYRGVLFVQMGRKADAEKDLAKLKTLQPKLAAELEQVIKTGKEEEESSGWSGKKSG